MTSTSTIDPSPFGVTCHEIQDEGLQTLAAAGIQWMRCGPDWPDIEPVQGQYDWSRMDRLVAACQALGVSILSGMCYTPTWASGSPDLHAPARDPGVWLEFVRRFVDRYDSAAIQAWGVWNEPNLQQFWTGNRRQFIRDFWVPALEEIKLRRPESISVGPDLSSAGNNRCLKDGWMSECLDAAGDLLDVISHHQYDGGDTPAGRLREIDRVHEFLLRRGDSRPLWITEIGWDRVTPDQQAEYLKSTYYGQRDRPWLDKVFWYDSHGFSENGHWGLLETETLAPRPSYTAYSEIAKEV